MLHGLLSRDIVLREGRRCAPQSSCLTRRSPGHISTPKKIPPLIRPPCLSANHHGARTVVQAVAAGADGSIRG